MIAYNQEDQILARIAKAFEKRLKKGGDYTLLIDESLSEYTGKIEGGVIRAGSYSELLNTAGRVLRNPSIEGTFTSHKKVSGMYFATHFQNYLDAAPIEEIGEYIADLAFWGMNAFGVWFDMHHYHNMEEGKECSDRLYAMLAAARDLGVKTQITILANEAFADSPKHLRADWTAGHDGYVYPLNSHYHVEICPSVEGGIEKIVEYRKEWLEVFRDINPDMINIGAYDQGGCSCTKCAPWGSNGFIRTCEAIIPMLREAWPNAEIIASLWQFGTFTTTSVEFEGINAEMKKGRLPEVAYFMSEPQCNRYAVTHEMERPIVGFPEISMRGATPWGGYGTNPLPKLLQEVWGRYGDKLEGGFPYSEGLFEDLNKVIMLRFYRDNQNAYDTVREYLAYEFGLEGELLELACQAVTDMEETLYRKLDREEHTVTIEKPEKVFEIEEAMVRINGTLPEEIRSSARWQLFYLRGLIDAEFIRTGGERNERIFDYFYRLIDCCHLQNAGSHTKPDVKTDGTWGNESHFEAEANTK